MKLKETFAKAKYKATSAAVNAKNKVVDTVKAHPGEIIAGAVCVATFVIPGICISRGFKENKAFNTSVRKIYGSTAKEGYVYSGNTHKLWGMSKNWEEVGKPSFDKVKNLVGELNLEPGEYFELQKLGFGKHKGQVEVFHMLDNGFYHDEII